MSHPGPRIPLNIRARAPFPELRNPQGLRLRSPGWIPLSPCDFPFAALRHQAQVEVVGGGGRDEPLEAADPSRLPGHRDAQPHSRGTLAPLDLHVADRYGEDLVRGNVA